jgi:hypothetical protein
MCRGEYLDRAFPRRRTYEPSQSLAAHRKVSRLDWLPTDGQMPIIRHPPVGISLPALSSPDLQHRENPLQWLLEPLRAMAHTVGIVIAIVPGMTNLQTRTTCSGGTMRRLPEISFSRVASC